MENESLSTEFEAFFKEKIALSESTPENIKEKALKGGYETALFELASEELSLPYELISEMNSVELLDELTGPSSMLTMEIIASELERLHGDSIDLSIPQFNRWLKNKA